MRFPKITYLAPSPHGFVPADTHFCEAPMPLSRRESEPVDTVTLSYGHYFKGIADVISRDDYRSLVDAICMHLGENISAADIKEVRIYAEKHGSDYHPAKIEVLVGDVTILFVMNVAVTPRGKARLRGEFDVLQHLNNKYGLPYLPRTYVQGEVSFGSHGDKENVTRIIMFLADWFEGYHEFHLSMDKEHGVQKMLLWDRDKGNCYLSELHAKEIYSQAAKIMTLYYDVETFKQIIPWHHAAGDFVVRTEQTSLDVKLVTARQYASMVEPSENTSVYEALLFFLLNLSIRMRLDRLDGVGDVAWADDRCVDATIEGFLEGLRRKEREGMIGAGAVDAFLWFCGSFAKDDLSDRFHALVDACDPEAPDMPVIRTHLGRHISKFFAVMQSMGIA